MSEAFVGEIRMFGGNYAPEGWAMCNGQLLPISENEALFALIGTTYGGDGQSTFAVPDLRGRLPVHMGQNPRTGTQFRLAQAGGTEAVTLSLTQLPAHSHQAQAITGPSTASADPENAVWTGSSLFQFSSTAPDAAMSAAAVQPAGAAAPSPHTNLMPSLTVTFIICLNGLFPSRS